MISAYVIPGVREIKVFKRFNPKATRIGKPFVSIDPNSGDIRFSTTAVYMLNLRVNERVQFLIMEERLYIYKSTEGTAIRKKFPNKKMFITCNRTFAKYLINNFNAHESFRCDIKLTGSRFNDSPLFELTIPKRYSLSYFMRDKTDQLTPAIPNPNTNEGNH